MLHTKGPSLLTGQQEHAPAVSDGDAGRDIRVEKQLFHRDGIGLEQLDQLCRVVIDLLQTRGKARVCRRRDDAAFHQTVFPAFAVDDAEADRGDAGVDPQYPHSITSFADFIINARRVQHEKAPVSGNGYGSGESCF